MGKLKTIKHEEIRHGNRFVDVKRIKNTEKDKDFISITTGIRDTYCKYPKHTVIVPIERADELADMIKKMAKTSEKVYKVKIPIILETKYVDVIIETEETNKHKIMEKAIEKAKRIEREKEWDVDREVLHKKPLSHYVSKQKKPQSIREILDGL